MTARRVVVALGGNAFAAPHKPLTMAGQFAFAREALTRLQPLLGPDTQLLIVHGNGPQVGQELMRVEAALGQAYALPLDVCVAESEGELGYVLARSLHEVLSELGQPRLIASLLTQVVVAADDPAFTHPSKPIGVFYSASQADEMRGRGWRVVEDAGRGYRRVVPSPRPVEIIEAQVIGKLLELGVIVIAAGGGGIPVVRREHRLIGVEAVIDKDLTAALLAHQLDAELLVILTDVPAAYCDFATPHCSPIHRATPRQLVELLDAGHFAPGSMRPKIEAVVQYVDRPGRRAIICNPPVLPRVLGGGDEGTQVEFEDPQEPARSDPL